MFMVYVTGCMFPQAITLVRCDISWHSVTLVTSHPSWHTALPLIGRHRSRGLVLASHWSLPTLLPSHWLALTLPTGSCWLLTSQAGRNSTVNTFSASGHSFFSYHHSLTATFHGNGVLSLSKVFWELRKLWVVLVTASHFLRPGNISQMHWVTHSFPDMTLVIIAPSQPGELEGEGNWL